METVFDMEPSSTSSTPTSLVSQCLYPEGQVKRGVPTGVGYSSGIVGAPAFGTHPGYWGGDGVPSGSPPLTQQDLAQVKLLPWPWLKSWKDRRSKVYTTFHTRNSERKREVRENLATASSVV